MIFGPSILVMLASVLTAATVRGSVGLGFALVTVPVFQLAAPGTVPVVVLLLALPLSIWMVYWERDSIDLRGLGALLTGRLVGTIPGVLIVARFSERTLSLFVGVSLLSVVVLSVFRSRSRGSSQTGRLIAGIAAGTVGTVAAVGGPIIAYAYRDRPGPELRSTLSGVFITGQVLSLSGLAIAGEVHLVHLWYALALLPALIAGWWASRFVAPLVDTKEGQLRKAILALATFAAIVTIVRAL